MTTIHEARFRIERELLELCADGGPPLVEQIDAVLCDEGAQVFFYVYLCDQGLNSGLPLMATVDLPVRLCEGTFDPAAFVAAFWEAGAPTLTRN
jgi:hypothetical protein